MAVNEWSYPADNGCHMQPSCLRCELSVCIHDDPNYRDDGRPRTTQTTDRMSTVHEMFRQGASVTETAQATGISRRSVYRILGMVT